MAMGGGADGQADGGATRSPARGKVGRRSPWKQWQSDRKGFSHKARPGPPKAGGGDAWSAVKEGMQWEGTGEDAAMGDGGEGMYPPPPVNYIPCTAGGKRPVASDFSHCPTPQTFVRCGPHHRASVDNVLSEDDIAALHDLWWRYRDDLSWPRFEKKPEFEPEDYETFRGIAQKVVDAMIETYKEPMVLDQATISNTNHIGHPPHTDNMMFDSVWWQGKKIRQEDEVVAAQEGAYVLWRTEKTSYRSYSCSVALVDPEDYEGGEVQFFAKYGDKEPASTHKCKKGCGVTFCGCFENIHAVKGVRWGFRLVLLCWTRPPHVRVPDSQTRVCYFRPGTGNGVWLTTHDMMQGEARKRRREPQESWVPKDEDDGTCQCEKCCVERKKLAWKDRESVQALPMPAAPRTPPDEWGTEAEAAEAAGSTPTTSAGNSPRSSEQASALKAAGSPASSDWGSPEPAPAPAAPSAAPRHCPYKQATTVCQQHSRHELLGALNEKDVSDLHVIWRRHHDDLSSPWYPSKPEFTYKEFEDFRRCAQKVVDAMAKAYGEPLVLDQATISSTNNHGFPPHADSAQFDSVWWQGHRLRLRDELLAARQGAEVLWKDSKPNHRNYSASVALTDPWQYGGGDLEFYDHWGQQEPVKTYRQSQGDGVVSCGCPKGGLRAVTSVKWGFRLVLFVWTRSPTTEVPQDQTHICYFRPGTGQSVWLTTADLENYPRRKANADSTLCLTKKSEDLVEEYPEYPEEEDQDEHMADA